MKKETNIQEVFTLPSKGKIYDVDFNPKVTLRSMTTMEEMKRLSHSDSEYKVMAEILDDCIQEELPISTYDMCIGDYQFLIQKLRIVTYGPEYKMTIQCPNCGEIVESTVDLDDISLNEYDENTDNRLIELPISKDKIKLKYQTPRMLDLIKEKSKEMKRKSKELSLNYDLMYIIMSYIDELNGEKINEIKLEAYARKLNMKDVYYLLQEGDKLNKKVGLDTSVIAKCKNCGYEVVTTFRIQPEFYGPTFD